MANFDRICNLVYEFAHAQGVSDTETSFFIIDLFREFDIDLPDKVIEEVEARLVDCA